ncbi:MAG TPA: 2,3,4,5-tetrahydropyridine-2,6-dicarboxylate N-succinyltransferase [Gammaproteobacteria bacterium]|nr:2,3,4,5-tetrahydropyridine-2,6-dicarboxylate N-succinyltransferase [Gammaproteobacteria bacterium]
MHPLAPIINAAFAQKDSLSPGNADAAYKDAVAQTIAELEAGTVRVAEKINNVWLINEWVKKAILLYFRLHENQIINAGDYNFYDKVGLRFVDYTADQLKQLQIRIVPPSIARIGTYIAPNCVLMACYINIGASIGSGSMIDIWSTIGSCAQIGKNCHISSNAVIGGVLEPLQANPVIIEDNCFVGAGAAIVEGVIVEENSVIAMGTKIGQSTKIYDRRKDEIFSGRVPAGSVIVPGTLPGDNGKYSLDCAVIIKTVDPATRAKVSINDLLRENIND